MRSATMCGAVLLLAACSRAPSPPVYRLEMLDAPAGAGSLAPRLAAHPQGGFVLSWLEPVAGRGHALRWARHDTSGWGTVGTVATGEDWFVNWADTPSVYAFDDVLVAHWLEKSAASTYAYDIRLAISRDDGASWSEPLSPHHDGTPTEHGFVSMFPLAEGFALVWLDGRETTGGGHEAHGGGGAGGMTLRAARFDREGRQLDEVLLDDLTCDCCPTDVVLSTDRAFVFYRDRTAEEIRDIQFVAFDGSGWSSPQRVSADGWHIPACPVNGPAAAAAGEKLAVAWFTAAGAMPRLRLAWADVRTLQFDVTSSRLDDGHPLGRVELVPDGADAVLAFWYESVGESGAELKVRRVAQNGESSPAHTLAAVSAARASGFPQTVRVGEAVYVAWTDVAPDGTKRVRVARLVAGEA
ncbi:MAG TPA: hypothetical protein VNL72_01860 [Gammaproteobacteria bacterium]|nr:hypothetical protein [Gammaproteobacteria bacterium]